MGKVRESPPYIVNTPEDGFFRVGLTTDAKTDRPDQVALGAGSGDVSEFLKMVGGN